MGMCRPEPGMIQSFSYYNRQSSKNLKCPQKRMLYCIRKWNCDFPGSGSPSRKRLWLAFLVITNVTILICKLHPCQIFDLKDNLKQTNTLEDDLIEAWPKTVPIVSRCLIIHENPVEGFTNPSPRHWVETKGSESSWKCLQYMARDN